MTKGHEEEKMDWMKFFRLTLLCVLFAVALFLFVAWLYFFYVRRASFNDPRSDWQVHEKIKLVGPKLQVNERADLKRFRAREEQILTSYSWEDKANGLVRIPIEEAMKRIAKKNES